MSYLPSAFQGRTYLVGLVYYSNSNWTLPVQFYDTSMRSEFTIYRSYNLMQISVSDTIYGKYCTTPQCEICEHIALLQLNTEARKMQKVKEHKHDVHRNFILWTLILTYIQSSFFSHHLHHCFLSESYNNVIRVFSGCQQEINFQLKRDVI